MTTMRAFYDAVNAIMPTDRPFAISMEVWQHQHTEKDLSIEYSIWDGEHHHAGSTPEVALDSLRACQQPGMASVDELDVAL